MRPIRTLAAVLASAAAAVLLAAPPAGAAAGPPRGYVLVSSGELNAPAGSQVRGSVTCPAGTVPYGGGVLVTSADLRADVNSSFPTATGWTADVNNGNPTFNTIFFVKVLCGHRPSGYVIIESAPQPVATGEQDEQFANCPSHTRVLGGGGLSDSGSLFVNMNTSAPDAVPTDWVVRENNAGPIDTHLTAFAICGKVKGYQVVRGPDFVPAPGTQAGGSAECPAPTVPIGGGVFSFSSATVESINSTVPSGNGWDVFMNNISTTFGVEADTYVICAGS